MGGKGEAQGGDPGAAAQTKTPNHIMEGWGWLAHALLTAATRLPASSNPRCCVGVASRVRRELQRVYMGQAYRDVVGELTGG